MAKIQSLNSRKEILLLLLLVILFLDGCSNSDPAATATQPIITDSQPEVVEIQVTSAPKKPTMEPYVFARSDPGSVTLKGRLIVLDPRSILPAPDDAIYLVSLDPEAPISTVPTFGEDEDVPQADVDERTGEFVFVNIQPGRYAVVAVTLGGTQFPTRKMEDGSYSIFDLTEADLDQEIDLSDLTLP